ncbi:MAG: hypothetical protein Q9218_004022 [Villophora microphyllina]
MTHISQNEPTNANHPLSPRPRPNAPPPPYSESVNTTPSSNALPTRASALIDTYVLPQLSKDLTTIVILVPSDVPTLAGALQSLSSKNAFTGARPGQNIIGFGSHEKPFIFRLTGADNWLAYWRHAAALQELENQLREELYAQGYQVAPCFPPVHSQAHIRIPGSHEADWSYVESKALKEHEARITAKIDEICLRTQNEMGLYESRTGKAIIIKVEFGASEDDSPV